MKSVWITAGALAAAMAMTPACAQAQTQDNPVEQGVKAWQSGDYKGAVDRWRGPAVAGDADAQFNLGQAYKLGRGVTADLNQAEDWYRRAAVQGHVQAQDNYGLTLFQNGKRTQAVEWLKRSSSRGEPRAQFVLGTMYFNGDGIDRDWVRAYALIVRSSQSGLPQASAALAQMDRYISLQDRQQGLTLARRYEEEQGRPQPPVQFADNTPPKPQPKPQTKPDAKPRPAQVAIADKPVVKPAPPKPAPPKPAVVRDGGWKVQVGAFGDPGNARKLWGQLAGRFPGRQVYYVKAGNLTRVLVGPYASRAEASGACASVKPCVPVGP
ncbi:SPOR domain-containing protein [Sphingomonas canadensis]|uniref:SPOR domain-containing protein n=1 Tax=Sphingomonas canadensis TaxID=1219257 RepID=A0ABW3H9Q9_9SPHN|nr:SPOR domain-containing protein [Sphingomonas canadensis]MCW3835499.1 SPOR domain-containing protein [Sphingomonas canadensis]